MKYPIFKVKFLKENIVERRDMAHSIRPEKLCLIHICSFLVLTTLKLESRAYIKLKVDKLNH